MASAADHLVGGGYFLEHRRVVGLPGDGGVDLPFAEGGRKLELLADVGDGHVGVLHVPAGEDHLEVFVRGLPLGEADALALQGLDVAPLDPRALPRHDRERLVGVGAGSVALDDADHPEGIAGMPRLEEGRHAHVADLHLALLHGGDHVGAGIDDLEANVDAVLLEEALLHRDEHRKVAEVVSDHHVDGGERLRCFRPLFGGRATLAAGHERGSAGERGVGMDGRHGVPPAGGRTPEVSLLRTSDRKRPPRRGRMARPGARGGSMRSIHVGVIGTARSKQLLFTIGYSQRFNPKFAYVKKSIEDGTIGEPVSALVSRHITRGLGNKISGRTKLSPAAMEATHDIDFLLWCLAPRKPVRVYAQEVRKIMKATHDAPDCVWMIVTMDDGSVFTIGAGWVLPPAYPNLSSTWIEMIGTQGAIL